MARTRGKEYSGGGSAGNYNKGRVSGQKDAVSKQVRNAGRRRTNGKRKLSMSR